MKKAAANTTTESPSGNDHFGLRTLTVDFLDTTWRIAVPVVIGAALGIWADKQLGTKPWLTLLLTIVGFIIAGALIRRQLAAVKDAGEDEE